MHIFESFKIRDNHKVCMHWIEGGGHRKGFEVRKVV